MSKYTKEHYEDVANTLQPWSDEANNGCLVHRGNWRVCLITDFADLFAADNPLECNISGHRFGELFRNGPCTSHCQFIGFDRELFLAACGLEPEPRVPLPGPDADGNVPEPPECPNCGQTTHTIGECV